MKKYKIIIIIETIIIVLFSYIFIAEHNIKPNSDWFVEKSPNGKHKIYAFIPENHKHSETTTAHFMIFDENYDFDTQNFIVRNNYETLDENNYEVEWYDDYAKLTIINYGGFKTVYRIYYEDLNFRSHLEEVL